MYRGGEEGGTGWRKGREEEEGERGRERKGEEGRSGGKKRREEEEER